MIEYPDAERLMAGELGQWLDGQRHVRADAIALSNSRIRKAALIMVPAAVVLFVLVPLSTMFKIWVTFAAGAFVAVWTQKPKQEAKKQVKSGINEAIARAIGLEYSHDCAGSDAFDFARAFAMLPRYHRASFEDQWSGETNGHTLLLHEAHLEERRRSGKNTRYVTVFRGIILRITFAEPFHGTTLLAHDGKFDTFFGGAKDTIKLGGLVLDRAQMVSPQFEDRFDVYTTDQTEARWLMHPEYIERLLVMEHALGGRKSAVLFTGGSMILAMPGKDMFESGSLDHFQDATKVRQTIDQFARVADLALALNRLRPAERR